MSCFTHFIGRTKVPKGKVMETLGRGFHRLLAPRLRKPPAAAIGVRGDWGRNGELSFAIFPLEVKRIEPPEYPLPDQLRHTILSHCASTLSLICSYWKSNSQVSVVVMFLSSVVLLQEIIERFGRNMIARDSNGLKRIEKCYYSFVVFFKERSV